MLLMLALITETIMRTLTSLSVLTSFAFLSSIAGATDIAPTIKASIHDSGTPTDGFGDMFNVSPFEGLIRKINTSQEDRAIQEFDVSAFSGSVLQSATLSGKVSVNNSFDVGLRTFDFLLYAGNGVADLSDFEVPATLVGSGSYYPPMPPNFTYSFDVRSTVQWLIAGGATWIGLKVVCTSDPNYPNILDDATSKLTLVPAVTVGSFFCPGYGPTTPCPCGNDSASGSNTGCLSSLGVGGGLIATGMSSLSNDTVVLVGSGMPNSSALYFQGTTQQGGGVGTVFGDGLRCATGTVFRLGTTVNANNASQYPSGTQPAVHVKGMIVAPVTRTYQVWYRNAAPFCTPSTFNLTNGWQLIWTL
jgi:hypothetical protein